MAPSQTLPDHASDQLKFSPRAVTRLAEHDEDFERTLRPLGFDIPTNARLVGHHYHSRESSIEKLQPQQQQQQQQPHAQSQSQSQPQPQLVSTSVPPVSSPSSAISPRIHASAVRPGIGIGGVIERPVDPKAAAYGHHRQTSIVHGIQHSRNGSLASSSSSPLSPQMIAAAGAAFVAERGDMHGAAYGHPADGGPASTAEVSLSSSSSRPPTAASGSTVVSGGPNAPERSSSTSGADGSSASTSQRKVERMHSKSSRRDHSQHPSHSSRHHREDQKATVGEYALHVLFTSFIARAEEKINECTAVPLDREPQPELVCGPGADHSFDQLIVALGHIAKQKPKPLIDSMMLWRKSKSDAANEARNKLQQPGQKPVPPVAGLQRRNTEPLQSTIPGGINPDGINASLSPKQEYVVQTERRSSVSTYLLCRVLLEVISQSNLSLITPEMEDKLEDIIFSQLKVADAESLLSSSLKQANWNIFTQLLGVMSEINFSSVASRFIQDLDRALTDLGSRGSSVAVREESEARIELVLGGMKRLRFALSPEDAWVRSCDFLIALGRLFSKSHGPKVKAAFCQSLDAVFISVAARANINHFTHPRWAEVLSSVSPRLAQLYVKPRHWFYSFPLTATLLCISPPETFASQWLQLVYPLQPKLKDRFTRPLCLQVVSRLVWTCLYRTNDASAPAAPTMRKLDEVLKLVLPATKRPVSVADAAVTEPLIQIIRFIGYKYPDFCIKTIIFPLVNADLFLSNKDVKLEALDPERMVVGIKAFLAVMADLEKGDQGRPQFPQYHPLFSPSDRFPLSPIVLGTPSNVVPGTLISGSYEESLSRPVSVSALNDTVREYYARFCDVLGKITFMCDNTFGGQAVLDEKFNSPGPKTPIADTFNFSRRDDHPGPSDPKQAFYELLHVAVQALPRCLSVDIPFNSLINLLCTGTAHVQYNIAESSAQSLRVIARHSHAQQVTMGFSRFIFNFDDRYSTMSEGGMLGPTHIENTLRLYVELLRVWIDEIRLKTKDAGSISGADNQRGVKLDLSGIWAEVDQVEAHGLFFLCSQSRRVRSFAITVLRLITEFDVALGKSDPGESDVSVRLIDVLEKDYARIMSFDDEHLSVAERSRLQRGMQDGRNQGLIELCASDVSYDTTLWFKVFPHLIRVADERCPFTIAIGRDLICNRILQMYKAITIISEPSRGYYGSDPGSARLAARTPTTHPELLVEQWKLYLVFACTTMADPGSQTQPQGQGQGQPQPPHHQAKGSQGNQHARKGSNNTARVAPTDKIVTARTLFKYLNPMLSARSDSVREAVVVAMGSINVHIYRTLLEELQSPVTRCNDEARARIHQRTNSNARSPKTDLLRTEITHVYRLTSHFLREPSVLQDDWILGNLVSYAKDLKLFLMDGEVQMDWEFQKLRRHYCGLVEEIFEGINRTRDPSRWMTFEARKSAFALMEDWCGFSPNQPHIRQREDTMRQSMIEQQSSMGERGTLSAAMEIEKRNLRTAALSAMASLCGGPISVTTESGVALQFDLRRMLGWIESIFTTGNDRMKLTGRRALKNLILHNQEYPYLLEHCIGRCYLADLPKVLESYFAVICEVLLENPAYQASFWKLLPLCLFTLGNDQSDIRTKSARMLRALEERQYHLQQQQQELQLQQDQQDEQPQLSPQQPPGRSSATRLQDFDISIADKTKAVYKLAQYKISERLSKQYTELAFLFFSELSLYFKNLQAAAQRNMVAVVLPWIQAVELKVDPNGGPVAQSYMLLANLLEITIRASAALHNEVQALWQALATGPHPGNVRLVLDFIMSLCLERREQNFVEYAKQIVVFLASAASSPGHKVVEFLLLQIAPKAMVPNEKRESMPPPQDKDMGTLPYCAELGEALPVGTKQAGFSLGQLSMILLVDLMVSPVKLVPDSVPVLLQVVTVLWDHYTPLVQEQAREMLVHLIHELVISRLDDPVEKKAGEDLIDLVRRHDRSVVWNYEDSNGKAADGDSSNVPPSMERLAADVVRTFETTFPGIQEQWARLSLTWATSCPVRHLACRSFQIFRCIHRSLDQHMLGDMLARLSNTVADEDAEIQTFAMEILTTLRTLITSLDPDKLAAFPQLFWTTCACLESINEREFLGAVEMLNVFLDKLDFHSPAVRRLLLDGQPSKWDGHFEGLQPLLYKGLRSSVCFEATLATLDKLILLPNDPLIGEEDRLMFSILANLPRFLHAMDSRQAGGADETAQDASPSGAVATTARNLLGVASAQGHGLVVQALSGYLSGAYRSDTELTKALLAGFQEMSSPQLDFKILLMVMGFLTNRTAWVKLKTMRVLRVIIPETDMKRPEIGGHGSDLLSPLLRQLQTAEYCMQALEVLDSTMSMPGSSMDKQHLRMSVMRSGSRAVRKEYERMQSLFGIPEESGWAIPIPARKTDSTRANIHAAFYTCQTAAAGDVPAPTPEVEFHADEFPYGYFPPPAPSDRTDTMMSDDVRADGSGAGLILPPHIGDLVMKLDSLDDFFDDDLSATSGPGSDGRSSNTVTEFSADPYDMSSQLYDEQVLPILHQASSTTSFQNGFIADRPMPLLARDGHTNTMSPGAFTFGPSSQYQAQSLSQSGSHHQNYMQHSPPSSTTATIRPALHSRSITSPSAPPSYQSHLGDVTSDEELFSDGDDDRPTTSTGAGRAVISPPPGGRAAVDEPTSGGGGSDGFFLENMTRPLKQSTRTRIRRLTGGSKSRDERPQLQLQHHQKQPPSPQVPKVPASYLGRGASPPPAPAPAPAPVGDML